MCGGKGTRTGSLAARYGSKSFIPIEDVPALEYVLRAVGKIPRRGIFLCVERDELTRQLNSVLERVQLKDTTVHVDSGLGTMYALYELRNSFKADRVLVLFGHHLVLREHLEGILETDVEGVVLSLYRTSSDELRKVTSVDERNRCHYLWRGDENTELVDNQFYGDVPYLLPLAFVQNLPNRAIRSYEALREWFNSGETLYGYPSSAPHEFHFAEELETLRELARALQKEF